MEEELLALCEKRWIEVCSSLRFNQWKQFLFENTFTHFGVYV